MYANPDLDQLKLFYFLLYASKEKKNVKNMQKEKKKRMIQMTNTVKPTSEINEFVSLK